MNAPGAGAETRSYSWHHNGAAQQLILRSRYRLAGEHLAMRAMAGQIPGYARRWISEICTDSKSGSVIVELRADYDAGEDTRDCLNAIVSGVARAAGEHPPYVCIMRGGHVLRELRQGESAPYEGTSFSIRKRRVAKRVRAA